MSGAVAVVREPFQPIGDEPRWKPLYRLFAGRAPGTVVSYTQMSEVLDGFDPDRDRSSILRAGEALLRDEQRAVVAVPRLGYRVAAASEHLDIAKGRGRRARRQTRKGAVVSRNFRRDEVDAETAARLDRISLRLDRLEHVISSVARRQSHLDVALAEARVRQDRDAEQTQRQLAALRAALAKHGIVVDDGGAVA